MFPKDPLVKVLFSILVLFGGPQDIKSTPSGNCGMPVLPPISLSFPLCFLPGYEMSGLFHPTLPPWCVPPQVQGMGDNPLRTETSKAMNQNKPFFFLSWLSQVFVTLQWWKIEEQKGCNNNMRFALTKGKKLFF